LTNFLVGFAIHSPIWTSRHTLKSIVLDHPNATGDEPEAASVFSAISTSQDGIDPREHLLSAQKLGPSTQANPHPIDEFSASTTVLHLQNESLSSSSSLSGGLGGRKPLTNVP
jgi:hypothetical protein